MSEKIKKLILNEVPEKNKEREWREYFDNKNTELETEYRNLLDGAKDNLGRGFRKVGYKTLRDFYDGDQWQYVPEGGSKMNVYNFCRSIVLNYTAFMTNEPIDIDVPALDITDEIEVARAEQKEKYLKETLDDNKFNILYETAVQNGSLLGDSIILGPFYDDEEDRILIQNVKRPENVRIIWTDGTYQEIFGFIHHYYVSPESAYEQWGDLAKEKGVLFETVDVQKTTEDSSYDQTARKMVMVMDCWTKKVHQLKVGNKVLIHEDNAPDFVPIIHIPNIVHPEEPFGTSDIEDIIDAQVDFNEKTSEISEIISQTAFPYIFGKNLAPMETKSGMMNLIDIGDEAEIVPDPRVARTADLNAEIRQRNSNVFQLSGLNENIFGGTGVKAVTGRALSVLMQTVNNRIKGRQARWTIALQQMFENIFKLTEMFVPGGKELVGEYYKTDIFFPGTLLRNITDEINKFNAKLQSQETTMKNLGVPSPKDEKKLMKRELQDDMLMVEISRNPGLQMQIAQMMEQQIAQKMAGQKPVLREDQNFEEQPAAQAGAPQQSAIGVEGAVTQAGQRAGESVPIKKEAE